jgi:hypothetical protein
LDSIATNCGAAEAGACAAAPAVVPQSENLPSQNSTAGFRWSQWAPRIVSLNAPREDGAIVIEPPPSLAGQMAARNQAILQAANYDVQGRDLRALSRDAREQLLATAATYTRSYRDVEVGADSGTIFLAGHQPEMFHPGVWFKNFALARLARQHNAVPINLVIDSDAMKSASLRVPGGSVEHPRIDSIPFDKATTDAPFEQRPILDRDLFAAFGRRCAEQIKSLVSQPIVNKYWPLVLARSKETNNLGACLAQGRHQLEQSWDLQTLEIPQSQVCDLPAMQWLIVHLLAHLPRLWEAYNHAVAGYRREHHVRSAAHPAPELTAEDDWLEAPFWIWSANASRRRRLFVRQRNDHLLLSDRAGVEIPLSINVESDAGTAVDQLIELGQRGIRIRTRALITTLAARVLLGDLFMHGIGGAKYDQVTDRLICRFFGLEPLGYMVVSGTLRLPISRPSVSPEDLRLVQHRLRELEFHPEVFLDGAGAAATYDAEKLVAEKRRWIATEPTAQTARQRCHAIRLANGSLQGAVAPVRENLQLAAADLFQKLRAEAILASRNYGFVLFPELALTNFFQKSW